MTSSRATAIAGSAVVTLACCRIRIVPGRREPRRDWMAFGTGCGRRVRKRRSAGLRACSAHLGPHARVIAGLVIASRVYPTCDALYCGTRAGPSSDAIHIFVEATKDVDARDKRGHDG